MEVKALKFGGLTAKRPIVQGGMGVGVSLSSLAGNVAKCGGIGTISRRASRLQRGGFQGKSLSR